LTFCATQSQTKEKEIVIISFSDIHGNFKNLAKISAFVKETKKHYEHVIVVDAGDRFTGNPYNDFYQKKQFPIYDLLNTLGLDVGVIGNHEFDYGVELLSERIQQAEFVEILANIDVEGTILSKIVSPYHVIRKDDIEIGFLGLVCVDMHTGKTSALLDHLADFTFHDPIETAKKHKNSLRKKPDIYIALTHIGIEDDYRLADSVPELDLIIGGHSHYLTVEPEFRNSVKVLSNDRHGDHIFKTTISLKGREIASINVELIAVSELDDEDPIIVEKIYEYENNYFLSESFATLQHPFSKEQLGFLIVDAALSIPSVDLSILNFGSVRTNALKSGPVSYADILQVYPFSNHYAIIGLTPAEIRKTIESEMSESWKREGPYLGGFHCIMNTSNNVTKVVKLTCPNGKELDENRIYQVVMNNFLISRHFSNRREDITVMPIFVVDNIVGYLKQNPDADYRNAPKRTTHLL
jgi:2',3'-cyclic-nucleotide 2'-phosphodiesterase (5'-nucleotidase family)